MPAPTKATVDPYAVAAVKRFAAYPVPNMHVERLIQPFGANYNGFYKELSMLGHNGWDVRASTGTRLYAVMDGTIEATYTDKTGGRGLEIVTNGFTVPGLEGNTYRLRVIYYHLLAWDVGNGARVQAGQFVARADNTGKYTTGPHLHFGLKIDRKTPQGWEVLDRDNGFFGAIDPEPFWPDQSWQSAPADTRYGKPRNIGAEILWSFTYGTLFRNRFKRLPTVRERNGCVYGGWTIEEVVLTSSEWKEKPNANNG